MNGRDWIQIELMYEYSIYTDPHELKIKARTWRIRGVEIQILRTQDITGVHLNSLTIPQEPVIDPFIEYLGEGNRTISLVGP